MSDDVSFDGLDQSVPLWIFVLADGRRFPTMHRQSILAQACSLCGKAVEEILGECERDGHSDCDRRLDARLMSDCDRRLDARLMSPVVSPDVPPGQILRASAAPRRCYACDGDHDAADCQYVAGRRLP